MFAVRIVLVTGSRDLDDQDLVWDALDTFRGSDMEVLVVHGGARGADTLANSWCHARLQPSARFPANWDRYRNGAGPRRNRQMLFTIPPERVLAFPLPGSVGTWDMVEFAESRDVPVEVIRR